MNITCVILHDVDLIPENDGNLYACESAHPKHTTSRVQHIGGKRGYSRFYEFLIGGVLILTIDMYKKFNGFSNLYWGWGGEDDDLSLRIIERRMCIVRPAYELAIYAGKAERGRSLDDLSHPRLAFPHSRGPRNDARFDLLTWSAIRLDSDGLAQIEPLTRIVDTRHLSIVTHLKVDVNADGGFDESAVNNPNADVSTTKSLRTTQIKLASTKTTTSKTARAA